MGEGVIGFEEKTRNVHIFFFLIISYLRVMQPLNLLAATSRKMLWFGRTGDGWVLQAGLRGHECVHVLMIRIRSAGVRLKL